MMAPPGAPSASSGSTVQRCRQARVQLRNAMLKPLGRPLKAQLALTPGRRPTRLEA
jgi:hypothetical protein